MLKKIIALLRGMQPELYMVERDIPGIAAADALDANDTIGVMFQLPVPEAGEIVEARLIDRDDDTLALTAHLFTSEVTVPASDAAFTISAAHSLRWVTSITFDTPIVDIGSAKVSEKVGESYYVSPNKALWCICSTTGTPNIAAGAMPVLQLLVKPLARRVEA